MSIVRIISTKRMNTNTWTIVYDLHDSLQNSVNLRPVPFISHWTLPSGKMVAVNVNELPEDIISVYEELTNAHKR